MSRGVDDGWWIDNYFSLLSVWKSFHHISNQSSSDGNCITEHIGAWVSGIININMLE